MSTRRCHIFPLWAARSVWELIWNLFSPVWIQFNNKIQSHIQYCTGDYNTKHEQNWYAETIDMTKHPLWRFLRPTHRIQQQHTHTKQNNTKTNKKEQPTPPKTTTTTQQQQQNNNNNNNNINKQNKTHRHVCNLHNMYMSKVCKCVSVLHCITCSGFLCPASCIHEGGHNRSRNRKRYWTQHWSRQLGGGGKFLLK